MQLIHLLIKYCYTFTYADKDLQENRDIPLGENQGLPEINFWKWINNSGVYATAITWKSEIVSESVCGRQQITAVNS
ncbi:hypothetical protein AM10699_10790 [Acaryochloris marina MBIC10699]|nr:hypothetical protein AM10699_10790 [Acaryochloris marina MBIC10699]